jgi:hypothetical protein
MEAQQKLSYSNLQGLIRSTFFKDGFLYFSIKSSSYHSFGIGFLSDKIENYTKNEKK